MGIEHLYSFALVDASFDPIKIKARNKINFISYNVSTTAKYGRSSQNMNSRHLFNQIQHSQRLK